jgi:hypothetical protein
MVFTIYTCDLVLTWSQTIIQHFLEDEGFMVKHKRDRVQTMILSKGKVNPTTGFVIIAPDGEILYNMYGVVDYISSKGLRRC